VAVLPKRRNKEDKKKKGASVKLPKNFKGFKKDSSATTLDQLKRDSAASQGKEIRLKDGDAVTVRFLHEPVGKGAWRRFDEHYVREGKSGSYVPCIGDGCPFDDNADARASRKWLANVIDVGIGEVRLLKMSKGMVDSFVIKYERSAKGGKEPSLMRRNYTIIRSGSDMNDTRYEIENEDAGPLEIDGKKVKLSNYKLIDITEDLNERVARFYGAGSSKSAKSAALDDDEDDEDLEEDLEEEEDDEEEESDEEEDEEDEEEDPDEDEDERPKSRKRKVVDEEEDDDDDDDDEDDEGEEEEEDEDDEPVRKKRPGKKVTATTKKKRR
jgi:hypothetical protein